MNIVLTFQWQVNNIVEHFFSTTCIVLKKHFFSTTCKLKYFTSTNSGKWVMNKCKYALCYSFAKDWYKKMLYKYTWYFAEYFHRFMHGFEGICNILLNSFRINCCEWIIHPTLVPSHPIRHINPQVTEGFKVFNKPTQLVILY